VPAARDSHASASVATSCSTAPSVTPSPAKTAENPATKSAVLKRTSRRLRSETSSDVPASWARKAGITGSMHGERKDASPANAATTSVGSDTLSPHDGPGHGSHPKKRSK
jgi:hypothetical protein